MTTTVQPTLFQDILAAQRKAPPLSPTDPYTTWEDGTVRYEDRLVIPEGDLRVQILRECHDDPLAGHPGQNGTYRLLKRYVYWKGMKKDVEKYVRSCEACARGKHKKHKPYAPLKPLAPPNRPWASISIDFIEELPDSNGYNSILVVVDCFTKMAHFIPTKTTLDAPGLARTLFEHVFSKHGTPEDIVSD